MCLKQVAPITKFPFEALIKSLQEERSFCVLIKMKLNIKAAASGRIMTFYKKLR